MQGIVFIYSNYIYAGVNPIAFALEENGFSPAYITGNENQN